ncbi:MAG: hypothetical protein FJW30_20735, partial [Acidobacteria bacterium]|nr:hypothetical protein [Acidobacteriota bacterium]
VTCVMAARRGDAGIALGNVVGSNLFNILAIGGTVASLRPVLVPRPVGPAVHGRAVGRAAALGDSQRSADHPSGRCVPACLLSRLPGLASDGICVNLPCVQKFMYWQSSAPRLHYSHV